MIQHGFEDPRPVGPQSNQLGLAGFIVSLVGFVACAGILCPIGLVMSAIALRREPKGFAMAGVIIGLVGSLGMLVFFLVLGGLGLIAAAVGIGAAIHLAEAKLDARHIGDAITTQIRAGSPLPTTLDDVQGLQDEWKQDKWGRPYRFTMSEDKKSFTIESDGPDNKHGTFDDIKIEQDVEGGAEGG